MKRIVLSYINPDLDGIASVLAVEALFDSSWQARVSGIFDQETDFILQAIKVSRPQQLESWEDIAEIWLVDTHHMRQLPANLPTMRVVRISDHHPRGDIDKFSNAIIQNEKVGAVATLIAELYEKQGKTVSPKIAVLLQAAILSNTLDFLAPSTSVRDRRMYQVLRQLEPLSEALINGMRECRRSVLKLGTAQIVRQDTKSFVTTYGLIIIAQIEAPGALSILSRVDLISSMRTLAEERKASCAVLNIVDTTAGRSGVIVTDSDIGVLLAKSLKTRVVEEKAMLVDRILQRKSDIVPPLLAETV